MKSVELELISAFSDIVRQDEWERICSVFWIRGLDYLFLKDTQFENFLKKTVDLDLDLNYLSLYTESVIWELAGIIYETPFFEQLEFNKETVRVLSDLFLWSVLVHKECSFGDGFGGIEMMKMCRLDF